MTGPRIEVVYRGPFQGRRISFLLDAVDQLPGTPGFTWLNTSEGDGAAEFLSDFAARRGGLGHATLLYGSARRLPASMRRLRERRRTRPALVLAVGFTSLPFARVVGGERLVWCVNGIPEERLLHRDVRSQRAAVAGLWRGTTLGRRPDAAVVVSHPMADLIRERVGITSTFVAPTVVDRATFRPRPPGPGKMTYVGSGAPWQDLPLLAEIWSVMHQLDADLRFRVVSRDDRADVLRRALPAGVVEMVAAHDPATVADQLGDSQLGFIVRRRHIVNTVSYPTKFGEYVASGVGVVTTDIGWDIGTLTRATGCGLVLDVSEPPVRLAERVVSYLAATESGEPRGSAVPGGPSGSGGEALTSACDAAAAALDRKAYVRDLGTFLGALID